MSASPLSEQYTPAAAATMATPTVDAFLSGLSGLLRTRDAVQLRSYLLVEPPLPEIYSRLTSELRQAFPKSSNDALEAKCDELLLDSQNEVAAGSGVDKSGWAWPGFAAFIKDYLIYLRDVNVQDLFETHQLLSEVIE